MAVTLVRNKYKKKGDENAPDMIWANTTMDELRRKNCMCLNCAVMGSCDAAGEFFQLAEKYHLAMAMTRCGATDDLGNFLYKPLKKK